MLVNTIKTWSANVPLDQYKYNDPVCLQVAVGWRRKYRLEYYKPTEAEWEAYRNGETDICPDERPPKIVYLRGRVRVWKSYTGYRVVGCAIEYEPHQIEKVKIRCATGRARWYLKARVLHEASFKLHDMGEYDMWTTLDQRTGKYKTTNPDGTVTKGTLRLPAKRKAASR